jgi:DNA-binding response OmpR family regulator
VGGGAQRPIPTQRANQRQSKYQRTEGEIMDKKKIMIIEDDKDFVRLLAMALRAQGYDVAIARDAIMAISEAQKQKPDLILLDLGLPAGDGFLIMERMSKRPVLSDIPIIVVSARDPEANRDRALKAGAAAYFQKPADNDALMAAIRQATGER